METAVSRSAGTDVVADPEFAINLTTFTVLIPRVETHEGPKNDVGLLQRTVFEKLSSVLSKNGMVLDSKNAQCAYQSGRSDPSFKKMTISNLKIYIPGIGANQIANIIFFFKELPKRGSSSTNRWQFTGAIMNHRSDFDKITTPLAPRKKSWLEYPFFPIYWAYQKGHSYGLQQAKTKKQNIDTWEATARKYGYLAGTVATLLLIGIFIIAPVLLIPKFIIATTIGWNTYVTIAGIGAATSLLLNTLAKTISNSDCCKKQPRIRIQAGKQPDYGSTIITQRQRRPERTLRFKTKSSSHTPPPHSGSEVEEVSGSEGRRPSRHSTGRVTDLTAATVPTSRLTVVSSGFQSSGDDTPTSPLPSTVREEKLKLPMANQKRTDLVDTGEAYDDSDGERYDILQSPGGTRYRASRGLP